MKYKNRIASLLMILAVFGTMRTLSPSITNAFADEETPVSNSSDFLYRVNLGRADDVRLLMRHGASANQVSGEGVPALCLAAGRIDPEGVNVMKALLDGGANINARDAKGQTPLHYAAKVGNIEAINFLMEHSIDSYALDNNGDVARTAAYKAGQKDSVKAIDDYILKQTAEVTQQYRDRNRELAQARNPEPQSTPTPTPKAMDIVKPPTPPKSGASVTPKIEAASPETPLTDDTAKSTTVQTPPEKTATAEDVPPAPDDATDDGEDKADNTDAPKDEAAAQADAAEEKKKEESSRVIYDLAFNVCAFQYWSYCQSVGQTMDIDKEEVMISIESSKTEVSSLKKNLLKEYKVPPATVETISTSAQKRIYRELNNMQSNRDRHEKGVGKRDDMQERCELIARQWGIKGPAKLVDDTNDNANGKAGSKGGGQGGGKGAGKGGKHKTHAKNNSNSLH